MSQPVYRQQKDTWYLLDRRLGGPQISSGHGDEDINLYHTFSWIMVSLFQNTCETFIFKSRKLKDIWFSQAGKKVRYSSSRTGHEGPEGKQRYSLTLSLTLVLDEGGWSMPCPGHFTPGKEPSIHCTGGWVTPGLVWTGAQNLTPTRIQSPECVARSKILYWLCYPAPYDFLNTTLNPLPQSNESQKVFHYKLLIQTVESQYFDINRTKLPWITENMDYDSSSPL
jgi:hypothetical protein